MGNAKIIMVDDDPDYVQVVRTLLENEHYAVVTACSKTEGLQKIKAEKPDLIILDVMMHCWQDGFEMSRQLKKDPQLKHIPILMLTVVGERTGIDFKSMAGDPTWIPVDVFLEKPVETDVLLGEVKKLLSGKIESDVDAGKIED